MNLEERQPPEVPCCPPQAVPPRGRIGSERLRQGELEAYAAQARLALTSQVDDSPLHAAEADCSKLGDITKILCQLREYQDEIKYQTSQVDALATRVLGLEGSLESVASKLAAVEGTLSKMAAARPKAPPPSMPAPHLPADVGPGPAPSMPPGQWGPPAPDRGTDAGPPTTSLRLPPNVQILPQSQNVLPSRQMPTPQPVNTPQGVPGQNLVTLMYEGQSYQVPSAFLQ